MEERLRELSLVIKRRRKVEGSLQETERLERELKEKWKRYKASCNEMDGTALIVVSDIEVVEG